MELNQRAVDRLKEWRKEGSIDAQQYRELWPQQTGLPPLKFWQPPFTPKMWIAYSAIALVIVFIVAVIAGSDGGLFQYCHDRFYDQGFRGDSLVALIESCLDNPGPGAP
jgi:hypothetical protein